MLFRDFIKASEAVGWRVAKVSPSSVHLECCKHGCPGKLTVAINGFYAPGPCRLPHVGNYAADVFHAYQDLVKELTRRRKSLGLSQEEVCAAAGLAQGHISKLEAFERVAQFPTLQHWTATLGLEVTVKAAALPAATISAIDGRTRPLREGTKPRKSA